MMSFNISSSNDSQLSESPGFEKCDAFATVMGKMFNLDYETEHAWFEACMELK